MMKQNPTERLFKAIGWQLTLLNTAVLSVILVAITTSVYLVESATSDAAITRLLTQTVRKELGEDSLKDLKSSARIPEPPRPFNPEQLKTYYLLIDTQGQVHVGKDYLIPGVPNQTGIRRAMAGTADTRDTTLNGLRYRFYTVPVREGRSRPIGVLQTFVCLQARDVELGRILVILLLTTATGIVLSAAGARFLANRALIPIRRAFEQQEHFVADASHELRTPLTLLQADIEILKRALRPLDLAEDWPGQVEPVLQLPAADAELIDEMHAETRHMKALISDLLTLACYDAGAPPSVTEAVYLEPLLSSVVERLAKQIALAQLTFQLLVPETPCLVVRGDPDALLRLLVVLLTNAITYTPPGGQVWVQAKVLPDRQIEILIRDTGMGIAPADLPNLFTRFYRADKARTRLVKSLAGTIPGGNGLGLAIARSIVESHKGEINVSSPGEGQGSTFTVILPQGFKIPEPA